MLTMDYVEGPAASSKHQRIAGRQIVDIVGNIQQVVLHMARLRECPCMASLHMEMRDVMEDADLSDKCNLGVTGYIQEMEGPSLDMFGRMDRGGQWYWHTEPYGPRGGQRADTGHKSPPKSCFGHSPPACALHCRSITAVGGALPAGAPER